MKGVKFKVTHTGRGKIREKSLWVDLSGEGDWWNIWALDKVTPDILSAVRSAFELGQKSILDRIKKFPQEIGNSITTEKEWSREDEKD